MGHFTKRSYTFTCTPHVHTCLCIPAKAGPHLPAPWGWKAELTWATGTVSEQSAQDGFAMFIAADNQSKTFTLTGQTCVSGLPRATTRQPQPAGRELTTSELQV